MKFQKGNAGRPKGALKKVNAELGTACREALETSFWPTVQRLLASGDDRVRLDTMKWLTDRGYGRAPETVRVGIAADSPEGVLLALSKQYRPGADDDAREEADDLAADLKSALHLQTTENEDAE